MNTPFSKGISLRNVGVVELATAGNCLTHAKGKTMTRSLFAGLVVLGSMLAFASTEASAQQLYAGTSEGGQGKVYAYQGGTNWTAISPGLDYAVLNIVQFDGSLYASTESSSSLASGRVWRYNGGTSWTAVGDNLDQDVRIAVYNGQLYAGTGNESFANGGKLYRYDASANNFSYVGTVVPHNSANPVFQYGIGAMYSSSYGYLQLGGHDADEFAHFDGTKLQFDAEKGGSCVYDFAEFNNKLYGAALNGSLYGSTDGVTWSAVLSDDNDNFYGWSIHQVEPFQDRLYLGYENGKLAYLDSSEAWHSVLMASNDIPAMVADGNTTLYYGTGIYEASDVNGYVYAYTGSGAPTLISGNMDSVQYLYMVGVPDPGTLSLLVLAGGTFLLRRRRPVTAAQETASP